jgi:serralysin
MPTLTTTAPVANFYQVFRDLGGLEVAPLVGKSGSTEFTYQFGSRRVILEGSGLTTTMVNGIEKLSGGTITGFRTGEYSNGAYTQEFDIDGLDLSASSLQAAIDKEKASQSTSAVEDLFLALVWDVTGTAGKDFAGTQYSVDGVEILTTGGTTWTMGDDVDTVMGGSGNDTIKGQGGNDSLNGRGGHDQIQGGAGYDTIEGGEGIDTLSAGMNGAAIYGGADGDVITGSTDFSADSLFGGTGWDIINGGFGASDIEGEDGNDTLYGGLGNDDIDGGAGNDKIGGGDNVDSIYGGTGNDSISGDAGNDTIYASQDNDSVFGGTGDDTLDGGIGADLLEGGTDNDTLHGQNGNDVLKGQAGLDTLNGGGDDDQLYGGTDKDTLSGGDGRDVLSGDAGADVLQGGDGLDTALYASATAGVTANLANAALNTGDAQGDTYSSIERLFGSKYADVLTGDGNANQLTGGAGADTLTGGGGADSFIFKTAPGGTLQADRITDFVTDVDTILLDDAFFAAVPLGDLAAGAFVANTTGHAGDASDRVIYETDTGWVRYDADGTGAGVGIVFLRLNTGLNLGADDFVVI